VVIGDTEVARRGCARLAAGGWLVKHLLQPTDAQLRDTLDHSVCAVAVLVDGDAVALRYALLAEHLRPGVRLVITVFDRTVAAQLARVVPNCHVTSPADCAIPSIIGACLGDDIAAVEITDRTTCVIRHDGSGETVTGPWHRPHRRTVRAWNLIAGQARAHDRATSILLLGLTGLLLNMFSDWILSVLFLHEPGIRALYAATRIVATVGPADPGPHIPAWYLAVSSCCMLATIGFAALFTAGIVNRLLSERSVGLLGPRTLPGRDHIIVVGLGEVGLRLCIQLRCLGLPVVAIDRAPSAANLRLARQAGVPVLIAHAQDRATLTRAGLTRARALAAMSAQDLDNIEVAITALAVAPQIRLVLRAGDDDIIAETRSLFPIGQVRDVSALTSDTVTRIITEPGTQPEHTTPQTSTPHNHAASRIRCDCVAVTS
jgi:voltage-gated potassium channel Kch